MSLHPNLFRKQLSMRAPHPSPLLTPDARGVQAACTFPPAAQQLTTLNQGTEMDSCQAAHSPHSKG